MSRIQKTFTILAEQGRKGLIPFITAGYPDSANTVDLMHAMAQSGADVIELGVPFSDPMADGPIIQRSSERALTHGVTLKIVLENVKHFRERNQITPIVLMSYANPIEKMGIDVFSDNASISGVDGVIVIDYPLEESTKFTALMRAKEIDQIFLLAPTSTDERIAKIGKIASGYVYYVSLKGVTGSQNIDIIDIARKIVSIKSHIRVPLCVGFGIQDIKTARAVANISDAVVIGSRIIQLLENSKPGNEIIGLRAFITKFRAELDA
ncbi:MAG: tryptophan synthase subunit alpha [Burkholderia sp.]|nr:tryptophan synthase subunit alpha [Burkholderia sp.]